MDDENKFLRPPGWFIIVVAITAITGVAWLPFGINFIGDTDINSEKWVLTWLYPIYALISAYLAYRCYNDRVSVSWILLILVWLSLIAEIVLVTV